MLSLLVLVAKGEELKLDLEDEIIAGTLLTHDGAVVHGPTASSSPRPEPGSWSTRAVRLRANKARAVRPASKKSALLSHVGLEIFEPQQ